MLLLLLILEQHVYLGNAESVVVSIMVIVVLEVSIRGTVRLVVFSLADEVEGGPLLKDGVDAAEEGSELLFGEETGAGWLKVVVVVSIVVVLGLLLVLALLNNDWWIVAPRVVVGIVVAVIWILHVV